KPSKTSFEGFEGGSNSPNFEDGGGAALSTDLWAGLRQFSASVPKDRRRQAMQDGRAFLDKWGEQAAALGWTAANLFGLHRPSNKPVPDYLCLGRYDETGLIWTLQGREVVALTEESAAIRTQSGTITTYRKGRPPELGQANNSTDDFDHRGPR